ncbi:MAG TPA: serine/threonine-protein kinase [Myxococcota bacterium]|nr:serine/threonine-protein kinase [Myxococcota bacterium]
MQAPLGLPSGSIVADRYELTGELGRGERSIVYCARDRRSGGDVALKLLALAPETAHFARQRLRRESEIVRALAHPGIIRPIELVDHGSWSLIAMELVAGRSLAAAIAADGPMHPDAVARLGIEVSEALSAAHRCGVVHHDLKPENILLDAGGRARLTDFGCARLEGQALLTLPEDPVTLAAFLPPEVIEGQLADPRSDVYSLGLVLYFALVGHVPKGQRPNLPPPPLAGGYHPREKRDDVPEWLDEIVARATRAEPSHRLETAERLGRALSQRSLESRGEDSGEGRALRVCVLCRRPGTLGRAVCPHCEDVEGGAADTLVLVVPAKGSEARDAQRRLLSELTSIPATQLALRSAANAQRALVRVSAAHAEVLVMRLRGRGVESRALPLDRAWLALPYWSMALSAATVLAGASAAYAGFPLLLLASIVPAVAALIAGWAWIQRETLLGDKSDAPPPAALVRAVSDAMPRLQVGQGRKLLIELLRIGRDLWVRLCAGEVSDGARSELTAVLLCGCDAASELARQDGVLDALQLHGERRNEPPPGLMESRALYHSARSRLVQAMLECAASLSRLRAQDMLEPEDERRALHGIGLELREELEDVAKQASDASQLFPGRPLRRLDDA